MNRLSVVFLGLCLFALVNVPMEWADRWRSNIAVAISPVWRSIALQTAGAAFPARSTHASSDSPELLAMRSRLETLEEWISDEKRVQIQAESLAVLLDGHKADKLKADFLRRAAREKQLLALRFASMPAQVVFRDPSSWSSSLWISLGEADNQTIGRTVVARNSPVLVGNALVGIVEYVGESQSRVRLLTDAGLVLAVRAMRGGVQNRELSHQVGNLLEHLRVRSDLFSSAEEQEKFVSLLLSFKSRLSDWEEESLAKGEICGCSAPLWRSRGMMLKGVGFNYNMADEEGPARSLRSGQPVGASTAPGRVLIQTGDLLVTSGLDGISPPGIPVAIATKIAPLKEGSYSYELEAKPAAGSLDDLSTVFVLPPLGFTVIED